MAEIDPKAGAKTDKQGGLIPPANFLESAEKFDFITLPEEIPGTNCLNCKHAMEPKEGSYICGHPSLRGLPINERVCCALWDATGAIRHWKDVKHLILKKYQERGSHPFHDQMNYQSLEAVDTYYGHRLDGNGPRGWMGKNPPAPERKIPGRDKALSWLTSGLGGDLVAPPAFGGPVPKKRKGLPVESGYRARGSNWEWEPIGLPQSSKALPPLNPGHQPTLAIDMDGTIAKYKPGARPMEELEPQKDVVESLQRFHQQGWRIIIWTVRDDVEEMEKWLDKHKIPYDFINENPDQPTNSRKILADYYIDDRAIHLGNWYKVVEKVSRQLDARQPVSADVGHEKLLRLAEKGQPELEKFLRLLNFPMVQIKDMEQDDLQDMLSKPGPMVLLAPPKGLERAQVKVDTDYDGDWSKLLDMVRAAVAVDSWKDLEKAVEALDEVGLPLARKPKNRFKKPLHNGYRDFLVNYRLPSGMVCEVQFHLKPILQAREREKEHYQKVRAIRALMEEEDRDSMTPDEILEVENILDNSKDLFEEAWESSREGAPEWEKKALPYFTKQNSQMPGQSSEQEQEETRHSPYLHWHKYLQKQAPPDPNQPDQMAPDMMGGQPEPPKVRRSPYLHWHKYFIYSTKAEHGGHTVEPVSPTPTMGAGTTQTVEEPAYTGMFRDRLGRLICYLAGKKIPCRQGEDKRRSGEGEGGGGFDGSDEEDSIGGDEDIGSISSSGSSEIFVNYAIVFNSKGKILENPDDAEFGGFIWTLQVPSGDKRDEEQAVINQLKEEGTSVQPFDELGNAASGQGYWILFSKEGKGNWLSIPEVQKRIDATPREEWHARGQNVLKEAVNVVRKSGQKSLQSYPQKIASGPEYESSMTPKPRKETGTTPAVQPNPIGEGPSAGPVEQPEADELFPDIPEISPSSNLYKRPEDSTFDPDVSIIQDQEEQIPLTEGSILPEEGFSPYEEWTPKEGTFNSYIDWEPDAEKWEEWTPGAKQAQEYVNFIADIMNDVMVNISPAGFTNIDDFINQVADETWAKIHAMPKNTIPDGFWDLEENFYGSEIERNAREVWETYYGGDSGEKSLPTDQWGPPDWHKEKEEIQRTSRELGLDIDDIYAALENGQLTPLPDQIWSSMSNTDSWNTTNLNQAREVAEERDRSVDRVLEGFQSGRKIPAPIVLILPDGSPYLIGGNTRLMTSRATNSRPEVFLADMRHKSFEDSLSVFIKAGPSFTGSFLDSRNRRTCLQDGKHVPCEEFGGQGRGWTSLREEEDLYDATKRLIDKVKTGSGDWSELFGLLAHAHPEELQKIIRDHKLSTPPESKPALQQFVQEQLQQMGHTVGQQPQQQAPQLAPQPQSGMM